MNTTVRQRAGQAAKQPGGSMKQTPAVTGDRFAIMCRVSTKDQLDGYSLEVQEQEAREYVQRVGGTVVKVYSAQESASGGMATRDELQRLLADADNKLFDAVVIRDLTRLARNLEAMAHSTARLVKAGVALHTSHGSLRIETAFGKYVANSMAVQGNLTSDLSREASISSRERVLKAGVPAAGRPPFGRKWNKEKQQSEIIPERRAQIARVFDLVVRRGKSMRFAAAQLDMAESSLRKAIADAALTEFTQHLNGQEFTFPCPTLLTAEKQQQLMQRLASNATVRPQSKNEYLLQGLTRCAGCGGSMSGQTSTKDGRSHAIYRHPMTGEKLPDACTWGVPVKLLDDHVLMACAAMIENGDALRNAIRTAIAQADSGQTDLAERIADLERLIAAEDRKMAKEADAFVEAEKGSAMREQIKEKNKRTERKLVDLRAEHAELSGQLAVVALPKGGADAIAAALRSLYWHRGAGPAVALPFARRKEFVRTIVGRTSRTSEEGIFVRAHRPTGARKKDISWSYELRGCVGIADGLVSHYPDEEFYSPEVRDLRVLPGAVKELAALAAGTPGIQPQYGKQSAKSKMRARGSSDD